MKTNKSNSKLKLNKSAYTKSKSKSKIKVSLSHNKSSYHISQYLKNKNDLILSYDKVEATQGKIDEKKNNRIL